MGRLAVAEMSCLVLSFEFSSFISVQEKCWWPIRPGLERRATIPTNSSCLLFSVYKELWVQEKKGTLSYFDFLLRRSSMATILSYELSCGFTDSLEEGVLLLVWKLRLEKSTSAPWWWTPVGWIPKLLPILLSLWAFPKHGAQATVEDYGRIFFSFISNSFMVFHLG